MGKGSRARPIEVPRDDYRSNWDKIFGKKDEKEENPKDNEQQDKTK